MTTRMQLCEQFGIDLVAAEAALAAPAHHDHAPWYVQVVLGIGAWITVIAGLFFVWAAMSLGFDVDEPNLVVAVVGVALFGGGFSLLQRGETGAFVGHLATALCICGTVLVGLGVGVPSESLWAAALATLPLTAAVIWQQRSALLQFLLVSLTIALAIFAVWDDWHDVVSDLPAIAIPIGALLLLYPPRLDLRPTAFALLVIPQLIQTIGLEAGMGIEWFQGWLARLAFLAVFACLVFLHWQRTGDARRGSLALAGAMIAAAATLLMPSGASAALALLALAYTVGSRPLAVIGAVGEVYFIWSFYRSLQDTLLTKSIILMAVGAVLLLCYALVLAEARRRRAS